VCTLAALKAEGDQEKEGNGDEAEQQDPKSVS
jgi:hypothetical protein